MCSEDALTTKAPAPIEKRSDRTASTVPPEVAAGVAEADGVGVAEPFVLSCVFCNLEHPRDTTSSKNRDKVRFRFIGKVFRTSEISALINDHKVKDIAGGSQIYAKRRADAVQCARR